MNRERRVKRVEQNKIKQNKMKQDEVDPENSWGNVWRTDDDGSDDGSDNGSAHAAGRIADNHGRSFPIR